MKLLKISGATLAVLTVSIVAATNAFAHVWASGAVAPGGKLPVVITETWLLLGLGFGGLSVTHVVCSRESLGTVNGPNAGGVGTDTITEVNNLTLTEKKIDCESLHTELGICSGNLLALLTALHLPWLSELFLKTGDTTSRDKFISSGAGTPGFKLECTTGTGSKFMEECEGNVETGQLRNEANGTIAGEIPEQTTEKCTGGNIGHYKASKLIMKTENGEPLSIVG